MSVTLYHPDILDIFRSTLSYSTPSHEPPQQLSYDTTFNLGDFYLSILRFRPTEFESSPVIPLAYLIHERKLSSTHDEFFRQISSTIPELQRTTNTIIVTDGETAFRNAVLTHLPAVKSFLCWNHIFQVCLHFHVMHYADGDRAQGGGQATTSESHAAEMEQAKTLRQGVWP